MIPLIIVFIIIILILAISYWAYRMAFFNPMEGRDNYYDLPPGEQYEPLWPRMTKMIDSMVETEFEEVYITSYDGKQLFGRYFHVSDDAPLEIQFHGYKSTALRDYCGGSKLAHRLGYNELLIDQRSHGRSDGSTITFGIKERRDCLSWINYAINRFGKDKRIILSGLSMGAATVLMVNDLKLPDNVIGIISDCPYSSPKAIIKKVCKDIGYPPTIAFPFIVLSAFIFGHFNIYESSPVNAVKCAKIPILLIHGDDDRFVPCDMSREIHNVRPDLIQFHTFPDAGHGISYLMNTERYEKLVEEFINNL
ncbi:MAG: alpha/beta hydrolase [Lachnospiraceae bacterium]|nr:alpha/beta hydrolase [Lachnospiraceae bacterium]